MANTRQRERWGSVTYFNQWQSRKYQLFSSTQRSALNVYFLGISISGKNDSFLFLFHIARAVHSIRTRWTLHCQWELYASSEKKHTNPTRRVSSRSDGSNSSSVIERTCIIFNIFVIGWWTSQVSSCCCRCYEIPRWNVNEEYVCTSADENIFNQNYNFLVNDSWSFIINKWEKMRYKSERSTENKWNYIYYRWCCCQSTKEKGGIQLKMCTETASWG